jgi:subtilase family serine protease
MTTRSNLCVNRRRRLVAGGAAIVLAFGLVATSAAAASAAHPSGPQPKVTGPSSDIGYAVDKPLCATTIKAGQMTCFVMQRVPVKKGTPGAYAYLKNSITPGGPAGGYSPANLASLFHYDPTTPSKHQVVGIVDWYDDPHIASDLAAFDTEYGFPSETAKSFRKVNQTGAKSPLPSASKGKGSADEIALDVESVRSVCETCRILLVEAKAPLNSDIAVAENTAARMGATEISNSFGGPEGAEGATVLKAFNHPGVVITASTGDDGWYDWDFMNNYPNAPDVSADAALFPSTDPDVVAVGGIGNDGTHPEYVWNNNGTDDPAFGDGAQGAGGGGCSQQYTAKSFQSSFPGYTAAGCSGKRLAADVSALADPATGFDEYDTWGGSGWITVGGTSLAAPMVAAMYALAGGSGGAAYPAESIYENASLHPSTVTDVTVGGNGFCGGDTTENCLTAVDTGTSGGTNNPNAIGAGNVDCSFPRNTSSVGSAPPLDSECNAVTGYDGPTGVGTPKGVGLFTSTSPKITLKTPKVLRLNHSAAFSATATELVGGAHITKYAFNWGDGHSTSGTATNATHTYTKAGTHTVTLTVTDSLGQQSVATAKLTVGKAASIKIFRSKGAIKAGHKIKFEAVIVDPNTGGTIKKVKWSWGDHKHSSGLKVSHKWHKAGKYTLKVTVTDNAGIKTTFTAKIKVK